MGFNLVDLIKDQVAEQVTGYIGNMLGGDTTQAKKAFDGALPAILNGLGESTTNEKGAGALFDTLGKQDEGILDNIGDILGGNDSSSLIEMGTSALGSLLGGSSQGGLGSIVDAVSGYAGTDSGTTKSMMGLIAPLIFSVIKRKFMGGDSGFNVGSLVDMFSEQKENINTAIPKGLDLNFNNNTYEAPSNVAPKSKSGLGKFLPLALLAGAGWIAYNMFFSGGQTQTTEHTNSMPTQEVNMANLGQEVTGTMTSLVSELKGIKDETSAKAAIPALTEASNHLGQYASVLDKLPADAKSKVSKYVMDYLPQLKSLLDNVSNIPGVGPVLKPVVENLSAKLALFQ